MEKSSRHLQEEVDEVTVIMQENLNRVEERSEKLSDLDKRSEILRTHSVRFSKTARKVKVEKQKENRKMKLLLAGGVLLAVLVLIIIIAVVCSHSSKSVDGGAKTTIAPSVNASEG
ncbi:vesicle-associated membrane protein 5-like [Conger conger]|uniref:vesicle-associated membrane protein 5-like n=1 Tax=Conger conger TaxID=82655 RepID=UPI002A5A3AE4|nr:vesicle-associated membrane protein 5-like [Conger conger]